MYHQWQHCMERRIECMRNTETLHVPCSYHSLQSTSTTSHILQESSSVQHQSVHSLEWTPRLRLPTVFCCSEDGLCVGVFQSVDREGMSLCYLEWRVLTILQTEWNAHIHAQHAVTKWHIWTDSCMQTLQSFQSQITLLHWHHSQHYYCMHPLNTNDYVIHLLHHFDLPALDGKLEVASHISSQIVLFIQFWWHSSFSCEVPGANALAHTPLCNKRRCTVLQWVTIAN